MSIYYSSYLLNTYWSTDYFKAHAPKDYPIRLVAQGCRAFRRLPPNVKELAGLAKKWSIRKGEPQGEIEFWYDDEGYEMNPDTGKRLTDKEIDAQWADKEDPNLKKLKTKDIPRPKGGFPDPDTWEPEPIEEELSEYDGPDRKSLLKDIKGYGQEYVAKDYGIALDGIDNDDALADAILAKVNPGSAPLSVDSKGHAHKGKGAGGGQFVSKGGKDSGKGKPAGKTPDSTEYGINDILDELKKSGIDTSKAAATWQHIDPLGYTKLPNLGAKEDTVQNDLSAAVDTAIKQNAFSRPTIEQLYKDVGSKHKISVREFQGVLTRALISGRVTLSPYTSPLPSMPKEEQRFLMPLDREFKFYVSRGPKAP